jgi:hypothetical protein
MGQMTASNFDFFMHSIMLIYKDAMEAGIVQKGQQLPVDDENGDSEDMVA